MLLRAPAACMLLSSRLARSPRLTMPQSLPFSITGKRRTCCWPINCAAAPASISGCADTTLPVITSRTFIAPGVRPDARQRVTRSRSVSIQQIRPSFPHTGRTPILYCVSVRAATSTVSSGWIRMAGAVITSRTFMRSLLCMSGLFPDLGDNIHTHQLFLSPVKYSLSNNASWKRFLLGVLHRRTSVRLLFYTILHFDENKH